MGKYTDMDSDSQRLPEGFTRIGYDADDQTYTFRGPDGRTYQSEPGSRYGNLRPVGQSRPQRSDVEDQVHDEVIKRDTKEATRMMLPFALLVILFLLLMFKLVNRESASDHGPEQVIHCAEGSVQIQIRKGDTCWAVAERYRLGVDDLLGLEGNEGVDCDRLAIGQKLCVPE